MNVIKAETKLSVAILAGGKSSRMGKNKALLKVENTTLIEKLAKELGDFSRLLLSAADRGEYESLGLPMVYDEDHDIGPIEGIRRVLTEADSEYVFVCAVDMPFIKKELVQYMAQFINPHEDCYVITDDEHMHPLCAIYSKRVLPIIEKLIAEGNYRLREIYRHCPTRYISLEYTCFDKKTVKNINTKEEYFELSKPLVFCVSGYSDSGKTWLISKLINEFICEGYSCAAIKHDGHDHFSDLEGSDTHVFTTAGALCSAVFSDSRYSLHFSRKTDIDRLIRLICHAEDPPDFVIVEGMKNSALPKVEIIRRGISEKSVCDESTLICAVSDCISPGNVGCPVFGTDDVRGIFLCIKKYFGA